MFLSSLVSLSHVHVIDQSRTGGEVMMKRILLLFVFFGVAAALPCQAQKAFDGFYMEVGPFAYTNNPVEVRRVLDTLADTGGFKIETVGQPRFSRIFNGTIPRAKIIEVIHNILMPVMVSRARTRGNVLEIYGPGFFPPITTTTPSGDPAEIQRAPSPPASRTVPQPPDIADPLPPPSVIVPQTYQTGHSLLDYMPPPAMIVPVTSPSPTYNWQLDTIDIGLMSRYASPYPGPWVSPYSIYSIEYYRQYQKRGEEGGMKTKGNTKVVAIYIRGCYAGDAEALDGFWKQKLAARSGQAAILTAVRVQDFQAYNWTVRFPSQADNQAAGARHLTLRIHDEYFKHGYTFDPAKADQMCLASLK